MKFLNLTAFNNSKWAIFFDLSDRLFTNLSEEMKEVTKEG